MGDSWWDKIWDNVVMKYFWHWLIPFLCGSVSWPFVHNAIIQQIIGLGVGIVFNTTFDRKWTIAFIQITWLAGVFGYSGYLQEIGMRVSISGWTGAAEAILVLSLLLGIGCLFLWTIRGIKAILQSIKRILLFWNQPIEVMISKWYIVFLALTALMVYLGNIGFIKYLGAIGSTSGASGIFVMLVLWSMLIGFCCVVYWCFLGIQETIAIGKKGFQFSTIFRTVFEKMGIQKALLEHLEMPIKHLTSIDRNK